jgi:hypothetical protein
MTRWLYNSDGDPIAYIQGTSVYTRLGDFVGKLYADNTVWNGDYVGELFFGDRLIYDGRKLHGSRGIPGLPSLPGFVGDPDFRGPITIPLGFRDVDLT